MAEIGIDGKLRMVVFDDDQEAPMLEAIDAAIQAENDRLNSNGVKNEWEAFAYIEDIGYAVGHMDFLAQALITTLEHRKRADKDAADEYIAQPLLDAADSLHIPKLIISTQPDAMLFIEPKNGDYLVADTSDPEKVQQEIATWLGKLTAQLEIAVRK